MVVAGCSGSLDPPLPPTPPPPPPPANRTPVPTKSFTADTIRISRTHTHDLSAYFTDPDRDRLTFTAGSNMAQLLHASRCAQRSCDGSRAGG